MVIVCSLLSLPTSWLYNLTTGKVGHGEVHPWIGGCGNNSSIILTSGSWEVTVFTRLDLHNAYHQGNKWKTAFNTPSDPKKSQKVRTLVEWPVPKSRKQLQQFLGFANFYHRFIRDFSKVAAPPLLSPSPGPLRKTSVLKELLTNAPVLIHPNPTKQFITEVGAL